VSAPGLDARARAALARMREIADSRGTPRPETVTRWADVLAELLLQDDEWRGPVPKLAGHKPLVLYFAEDEERDEFVQMFKDRAGIWSRKL
jgi:hypothetical protein